MTLAASLYLSRGDRVVSDAGAVRELAASLAAGIAEHLAAIRRSVPGAEPTVLLHEPLLAQVMAGRAAVVLGVLRAAVGARAGRGRADREVPSAHGRRAPRSSCTAAPPGPPSARSARRGVDGFGLAVDALDERSWEKVAEVVEGGLAFWPELPPQASSQCAGPDVTGQADTLTRPWRSVGLPMAGLRDVVLLAGDITGKGSPDDARAVLAGLVRAARIVAERAED